MRRCGFNWAAGSSTSNTAGHAGAEEPYLRGTRVAVRHVASFVKAGHSIEQIMHEDLPDAAPAAVLEAMAYYYDHAGEIDAEIVENEPDAVYRQLRERLSPDQYDVLTGRTA